MFPATRGHQKPVGEWNVEEITAKGRQITVKLNGITITDGNLDELKDPCPPRQASRSDQAGGLAWHCQYARPHRPAGSWDASRVQEYPESKSSDHLFSAYPNGRVETSGRCRPIVHGCLAFAAMGATITWHSSCSVGVMPLDFTSQVDSFVRLYLIPIVVEDRRRRRRLAHRKLRDPSVSDRPPARE